MVNKETLIVVLLVVAILFTLASVMMYFTVDFTPVKPVAASPHTNPVPEGNVNLQIKLPPGAGQ